MIITVLKERKENEHRVAITPENIKNYINMGFTVHIEKSAGESAGFLDEHYIEKGASIEEKIHFEKTNILLCVQLPSKDIIKKLQPNSIIIGSIDPFNNKDSIELAAKQNIHVIALEFLPRITRAQSMDILSSQANLAGYRAVIEASHAFNKAFPLMMTAAGTVPATKVLVLGAGVAGLQAIATAKRLGAVVYGYDVRKEAKEQVESLGASFVQVDFEENAQTAGGYAKEISKEFQKAQTQKLLETLPKIDIVITTAQIPGKKAPILIDKNMVSVMKPGSVIVDLAAGTGGNCTETKQDEIINAHNITIIGYSNLAARIPYNASQLYAKNLFNFIKTLIKIEHNNIVLEQQDELIIETLLTKDGSIVNKRLLPTTPANDSTIEKKQEKPIKKTTSKKEKAE